ncbi:MAG: 50S ribosomal protein L6 [Nanoarchaeota archaeon]
MRKELFQKIDIPEGIEVHIEGTSLTVKGREGENKKTFKIGKLDFEKKGNQIVIGSKTSTKKEKRLMNTLKSHVENMIKGVQEKFEYKLKICFSHFPMTVSTQGDEVTIKNFLGEKISRKFKIPNGAKVEVGKDLVTITSTNKELAGQAAANFEASTKVGKRDRRIFQDGIFIINKAGKEI